MKDAFAGLQMPQTSYEADRTHDDYSNSSSTVQTTSPAGDLATRTQNISQRSLQSSLDAPSSGRRALPLRRAPTRAVSTPLQAMAQQALERQALPKERSQSNLNVSTRSLYTVTTTATTTSGSHASATRPDRLCASTHEPRARLPGPTSTNSTPNVPLEVVHVPRYERRRMNGGDDALGSQSCHSTCTSSTTTMRRSTYGRPYPPTTSSSYSNNNPRRSPAENNSNDNSINDALKIEISAGVFARLRGARETFQAVEQDFYRPVTCQVCQADVCCIMNASYLLCPKCRSVSPVEGGCADIATGDVGLGFTLDDLRCWQGEILARQIQSPSHPHPRYVGGRRQSMW